MKFQAEMNVDDLFQLCNIPSETEVVRAKYDREKKCIVLTLSIDDKLGSVLIDRMLPAERK